jgi:biopolymer transport protein ExbD
MNRKMRSSHARGRLLRRATRRDAVPLNLVSMIDVFTTLVFFLLITSTSVQTIRSPRSLQLPQSITRQPPAEAPVLLVTGSDIMLGGNEVMTLDEAEASKGPFLGALKSQLIVMPLMTMEGVNSGALTRGEITIMADKDLPYSLLKKIMATCGEAKFARISLAVNHRAVRSLGS